MDDLGLNQHLKDAYGTTVDGKQLFRLTWSTGITEFRHSTFVDYLGDIFLREVTETREVLKYPFAQDRWILERIRLTSDKAKEVFGLVGEDPYSYEPIYTFQDKDGDYLPLNREMLEAAMILFFEFYVKMIPSERQDFRMSLLAEKDRERRNRIRAALADKQVQAASSFVLERAAGIDRRKK
jgi:hypothetical protein